MGLLDKAQRFRALHDAAEAFVIANAWDAGSAKILATVGFQALATSSGAHAGVLGRLDGQVNREEALAHAQAIVEATDLPVSADLEKGFGDAPGDAAETIRRAAGIGLVGASIEDATGDRARPLYDPAHAAERVAAAVEAARAVGFPFVLTARTENYLRGNPDLDDTIRRLRAFEAAGADVLMAPGLPDLDAVRAVCAAVTKPVNFMAGIPGKSFTVAELAAAGVKRISLATSLYRTAMNALLAAATEVKTQGTFKYLGAPPARPTGTASQAPVGASEITVTSAKERIARITSRDYAQYSVSMERLVSGDADGLSAAQPLAGDGEHMQFGTASLSSLYWMGPDIRQAV